MLYYSSINLEDVSVVLRRSETKREIGRGDGRRSGSSDTPRRPSACPRQTSEGNSEASGDLRRKHRRTRRGCFGRWVLISHFVNGHLTVLQLGILKCERGRMNHHICLRYNWNTFRHDLSSSVASRKRITVIALCSSIGHTIPKHSREGWSLELGHLTHAHFTAWPDSQYILGEALLLKAYLLQKLRKTFVLPNCVDGAFNNA